MHQVIVLIPSKNEKSTLFKLLNKIKIKTIVVNDNSKDGTREHLKLLKTEHINNKHNLGYERSLLKGFRYIKNKHKYCKYILTIDADGEHQPKFINNLIKKAKLENADLTLGYRSNFNRISEYILSFFFKLKFNIYDPLTGFRIYKSNQLYKFLKKTRSDYFLVDLLLFFKDSNLKISNINITTKRRKNTKSRVGNIFISNLKILFFLKLIFR
jgi:cellulose synthase/poly-beta-1,6-N-acetylglucosamine synthase-like glycosyltransferase